MDKMGKERFTDNNYLMLKGMYGVKAAKEYFETLRIDAGKEMKKVLNYYIQKLDWIINDTNSRINDDVRKIFEAEVTKGDVLFWESLKDLCINLSEEQRSLLETLASAMAKGEEIKFVNDKVEPNY